MHDIASKIHADHHAPPADLEKRKEIRVWDGSLYHNPDRRHNYGPLHHYAYTWDLKFKHGVSSIVGYWAESMIFGGPILFKRAPDGTGVRSRIFVSFTLHSTLFISDEMYASFDMLTFSLPDLCGILP